MISKELSSALFGFSLRCLGAELEGGFSTPPPPSGGGKSRGPSGRGLTVWTLYAYFQWGKAEEYSHIFGTATVRHYHHTLRLMFKW